MTDCFGIEVSEEEISRWNVLDSGPLGFAEWREWCIPSKVSDRPHNDFWKLWLPLEEEDVVGRTICEIGCGIGLQAVPLLSRCGRYIGLDVSPLVVSIARMHFSDIPKAEFLHTVYDKERILGLRGKTDGVFGKDFFYHQTSCRLLRMMDEAYEMLLPGGWMFIDQLPGEEQGGSSDWSLSSPSWPSFRTSDEAILEHAEGLGFSSFRAIDVQIPASGDCSPNRHNILLRKMG
jgi:predicted TPR repeat methyltransferase